MAMGAPGYQTVDNTLPHQVRVQAGTFCWILWYGLNEYTCCGILWPCGPSM